MSADQYRRVAKIYDRVLEPMNAPVRRIGMGMRPPKPGMRVLDIGCGTGTHLELYLAEGCVGYGIDTSEAMLDQARNRLGDRAELILGDAANLPYPDGSFDLAIAATLLHELDESTRQRALAEVARVLDDDGRLLVIDFRPGSLRFPKGWLLRRFSVLTELIAGIGHYRNYRRFMRAGGTSAGLDGIPLVVEEEKPVAGGNIGLYLLRAA